MPVRPHWVLVQTATLLQLCDLEQATSPRGRPSLTACRTHLCLPPLSRPDLPSSGLDSSKTCLLLAKLEWTQLGCAETRLVNNLQARHRAPKSSALLTHRMDGASVCTADTAGQAPFACGHQIHPEPDVECAQGTDPSLPEPARSCSHLPSPPYPSAPHWLPAAYR